MSVPLQHSSFFALAVLLFLSTAVNLVSAGSNEAGVAFLKENKDKPGVITAPKFGFAVLENHMQYKVLKKGKGIDHPSISAKCSCHYEGRLIDGTVFDSSYERGEPSSFAPNQVIKGWTQAMQMMVVGDKWELYIPSELAYGDRGSPPKIGGGDVLIFQIEMLAILNGDTVPALKCSIDAEDDDCNEKEKKYSGKVRSWYAEGDNEKAVAQLERIRKIMESGMKVELRDWANRRVNILEQFIDKQKSSEKAEL
jgi:FKBP-type peptidyl-prolyl cis-trans isomerase FklB